MRWFRDVLDHFVTLLKKEVSQDLFSFVLDDSGFVTL